MFSVHQSICEPDSTNPDEQNVTKGHPGATSSTREVYKYDTLPQGEHFRYLVLQPGVGDEPLQCSLHTAVVSEVSFEAISYVWGSDVKNQEIVCEGQVVEITTNLYNVFKRIRLPDSPRNLYADGICINQKDQKEKGHQVALMGKIYRTARRVLIYIGPDKDGHGHVLCSFLDDVYKMFNNTLKTTDMSWDSFPHPAKTDALLTDTRWSSLRTLLEQEWFHRGWVVQEAGLAQEGCVIWGQYLFSWDKLMISCCWLDTRAANTFYAYGFDDCNPTHHTNMYKTRHLNQMKTLYQESTYFPLPLLQTLQEARWLELSDPRDRIYAFTEIFQDFEHTVNVRPDYSIPFLDAYQQFAIEYVRITGNVDILSFVFQDSKSLFSGIPSWIPRWDIRENNLAQPRSQDWSAMTSRAHSICKPAVTEDNNLRVQGVILDHIYYASDILHPSITTLETISDIWKAISTLGVKTPYPVSRQLHAFLDALIRGEYTGEWKAWIHSQASFLLDIQYKNSEMDIVDLLLPTLGSKCGDAKHGDSAIFLGYVKWITTQRRVFVTKRGYIGLCPSVALEGDLCAIIFGSTSPCILRETGEKEGYFKFVGASYIVGKDAYKAEGGGTVFRQLGSEDGKDWMEWDVEEQDIYLC